MNATTALTPDLRRQGELIRRALLRRYLVTWPWYGDAEQVDVASRIGLWRAETNWQPGRSRYQVYAGYCIRDEMVEESRRQFGRSKQSGQPHGAETLRRRTRSTTKFGERDRVELVVDEGVVEVLETVLTRLEAQATAEAALALLTLRQREIVVRRYCGEERSEEIAAAVGISRSRVQQLVVQAMDRMRSVLCVEAC